MAAQSAARGHVHGRWRVAGRRPIPHGGTVVSIECGLR